MVPNPEIAIQMSRLIWLAVYDTGRLEVTSESERIKLARVHDFPADEVHCQRLRGAIEGIMSVGPYPVKAEETQCAAKGAPYCEFRIEVL